jgi:lysozyme
LLNKLLDWIIRILEKKQRPISGISESLLLAQLKRHEGFRSKVYKCPAGYMTIGYGRNVETNGITKEEAEYLLQKDVEKIEKKLSEKLSWFSDLEEPRRAVLINMAFNLGIAGLLKWKNTLECIKEGEYSGASSAIRQSKYARQVGNRAKELANQMETGFFKDQLRN